ncbi:MAG TPA: hypothetical protein VE596_03585 [Gaiellaceae bacterium]|jgi:hypothetical protein|nr:hypothetical protein [Gaiellaceae bacterium]
MEKTQIEIEYDDWHAYHDHMSKTLHVHGDCTIRGGGVAASLEPREEQGANQTMLMLNLRLTPTGESPSHQPVDHRQRWDDEGIPYKEVGFVVVGGVTAPAPPALPIEDLH